MLKHPKESDETNQKILRAAKTEFANKGFNGARMSSIAAIAGVNQALLHYHFENKENLYRSIFQQTIGDIATSFSEHLTEEIDSWNPTPDIKLCAALYVMVSINLDSHDDELHRIFAREMAEGQGLLHEFVKNYMMPRLLIFESIIKDGMKQGIFEISDTMMFSLNVVAFINDFAHGVAPGDQGDEVFAVKEHAAQVGVEHMVPFFHRDVGDGFFRADGAGVVDQDVDLAEFLAHGFGQGLDVGFAGGVAFHGQAFDAVLTHQAFCLVRGFFIGMIGKYDIGAFGGESQGNASADTPAGAGDHCDTILQFHNNLLNKMNVKKGVAAKSTRAFYRIPLTPPSWRG